MLELPCIKIFVSSALFQDNEKEWSVDCIVCNFGFIDIRSAFDCSILFDPKDRGDTRNGKTHD